MISEDTQDQAALHALGLLDADEAAAFEHAQAADGELRALTGELREAASSLARTETVGTVAPPTLKARVLARIADEKRPDPAKGKIIAGPRSWARWLPWATAAMLAACCGSFAIIYWNLMTEGVGRGHQLIDAERRARTAEAELAANLARPTPDAVGQIVFCALDPVPSPPPAGPQAAVLWDAAQRRGRLQIQKLPPPDPGKDYQLWTLEAGHKSPVSAGVVKLDADGGAAVDFRPGEGDDSQAAVTAFALSVERAGGVPQNEGPILFVGKLSR